MKKFLNILIFTIVLTISSLVFSTVKAEKIRFYYECVYIPEGENNLIKYSETAEKYEIPQEQHFYFTDMKMKDFNGTATSPLVSDIFVKDLMLSTSYPQAVKGILDVNDEEKENTLHNTFDQITATTRQCPKYLEFVYSRVKHDKKNTYLYEQRFTNELSSDAAAHMVVSYRKSSQYDIYTEEKKWSGVYYTSEKKDSDCNGLHVEFKIKDRLMNVTYWTEDNRGHVLTDKIVEEPINIISTNGPYIYYSDIKKLAEGQNIGDFGFSVKLSYDNKNKADFSWYNQQGKNWCFVQKNTVFTENSCTSNYPEIAKSIEDYRNNTSWKLFLNNLEDNDSLYKWRRMGKDSMSCDDIPRYKEFYERHLNSDTIVSLSKRLHKYIDELKNLECKTDSEKYTKEINEYIRTLEANLDFLQQVTEKLEDAVTKMANNSCDIDLSDILADIDSTKTGLEEIEKLYKEKWTLNRDFTLTKDCGLIGGDLKKFLNTILWYLRVGAIVLAMILSLLDYIKAAAGTDDKPMTAANKRFITRLILIIVLFLLPVLLTFLFNVLNITDVTSASINCLK